MSMITKYLASNEAPYSYIRGKRSVCQAANYEASTNEWPSGCHLNCRRVDAIERERAYSVAELAGDDEWARIVIDAVTISVLHCKCR